MPSTDAIEIEQLDGVAVAVAVAINEKWQRKVPPRGAPHCATRSRVENTRTVRFG